MFWNFSEKRKCLCFPSVLGGGKDLRYLVPFLPSTERNEKQRGEMTEWMAGRVLEHRCLLYNASLNGNENSSVPIWSSSTTTSTITTLSRVFVLI